MLAAIARPALRSRTAYGAAVGVQRLMSTKTDGINTITIFGAGLMGAGIAQVSAQAGLKVILTDVTDKALENGLNIINKSVARVGKKQQPDDIEGFTKKVLANITTTTDAEQAVSSTDLVCEAIIESIKVKRDLFAYLDKKAGANTIFASNTSSLGISEIAENCTEERKALFGGLHFFNPVPAMKLVEVVRTDKTSEATYQALFDVTKRMGKVPVACKDTPGFIVNRLLVPYLLEAARMIDRGDATKEDIDIAMKLGAGYPMGPFELLDYIGLDTTQFIADGWVDKAKAGVLPEALVEPTSSIVDLVNKGELGRKSGKGFYDYTKK
ncbi:hypothetical protein CcaverHIS002_0305920 [Cutaneotrichosporon cavernicola]|uniref:3-hydroxyacyl-CoA dehydrogenase n=1 Tax=Cutaneotrichosporon cavernicola TaxID=279322 RepID=A0AA48L2C2_9TREE|nr:uncharacterized protein CcaverHIS019_0305870 [Cutaneotrichosporon cavernicola]BEI82724.1 hypothetical protein CcaverHIS002_0305920 [Cutaneotrichosporon cavernicola]BEI90517.1 hypothetical protein CcaverHIS019_0305870 [Cutaneotrichosporon cavernicola]BEI98291.1 hypothetical protein CcaverHIS631_0305900 [Cutaneotrichosporon cavernicola]BEJ06066.1 hypothetical protein CcaverHIS641_0305880 [Cutaneotrichosporon cavernicola]